MQEQYTHKGKHLTIDNRRLIERWKKEGKSNREIADLLGKAPQTINNEVIRALKFILGEHPILSITADNGSEFNRLAEVLPEEHIHYPQPYYSWERGAEVVT